jgi:serine/threonine protein kinase
MPARRTTNEDVSDMKILIADDDVMYRTLLRRRLRSWGYDVVLASDGAEAWRLLRGEHPPQIVVLDWAMPGMTGIDICRKLKRADPTMPFIYTIMLTGRDAKEDMLIGLESGANDYLSKPVDTAILRTRLAVACRIVEAVPPKEWSLPRVPGYEVKRLLGKGTAGSVWEAVQTQTGRPVALKIVRRDLVSEEVLCRFAREMGIMQHLDHPNVAQVYESRFEDAFCCYAMELIRGRNLGRYVAEESPSESEVLDLMAKVCDGVNHAHSQGVVHRDLKPQNILVSDAGEPKVVDFGLAKSMLRADAEGSGVHTLQNVAVGTPLFMAPEQARGENEAVDARTDVYAIGVMLYITLLRHHPHRLNRASNWDIMRSIADGNVRQPHSFRPDIDPRIERILMKALSADPDGRYASAGDMAADIRRFLSGK